MSDAKPAPLKISCTDSDCERDLHCFKFHSRKMVAADRGKCRSCGADLIDWKRIHQRDKADVEHTFASLKRELIRHHAWHVAIDEGSRTRAAQRDGTAIGCSQAPIDEKSRSGQAGARRAADALLRQCDLLGAARDCLLLPHVFGVLARDSEGTRADG